MTTPASSLRHSRGDGTDRAASGSSEPDRRRWNERYAEKGPEAWGLEAAEWLARQESLLRRQAGGPALDVACGNCRNAFFLARLGFEVDALDISDVVIAWAADRAREQGLAVRPRRCDLVTEALPRGAYSVVLNFKYLDRRLFPRMRDALAPGGLLIFETFTRRHRDELGRQVPVELTLAPEELRREFSDLEILDYREEILVSKSSGRKRAVARLVARR